MAILEISALPWLERLLSITTFFSVCNDHQNEAKNECNKYCIDCNERPLCNSCINSSDKHKDHRIIQIRRSSNVVVNAKDIQKHVNINGIQRYTINSSKVVFLHKRFNFFQLNFNAKNNRYNCKCKVCDKNLVDPTDFCSLECKLEWVKVEGSFIIKKSKDERKGKKAEKTSSSSSSSSSSDEGALKRKSEKEAEGAISRPVSFRRANSRRKGIPHRAPFF